MASNKNLLIAGILVLTLLSGCTQNNPNTPGNDSNQNNNQNGGNDLTQTIQKGDVIQVNYKGTLEDGTEFDSSLKEGRTPLEFTVGAGRMIAGFDAAVVGMKLSQEKTVTLSPAQAYGTIDPAKIVEVSKEQLGDLYNQIETGSQVSGPYGNATVVEKTATGAKIDFNHPLAGKTLIFWIKIEKITKNP